MQHAAYLQSQSCHTVINHGHAFTNAPRHYYVRCHAATYLAVDFICDFQYKFLLHFVSRSLISTLVNFVMELCCKKAILTIIGNYSYAIILYVDVNCNLELI